MRERTPGVEAFSQRVETADAPVELKPQCGARFTMLETDVYEGGASAEGFLECTTPQCVIRLREVTGHIESGIVDNPQEVAEAKAKSRGRRQIANECLVWRTDPTNVGQEIPNDRLPQNLQRS